MSTEPWNNGVGAPLCRESRFTADEWNGLCCLSPLPGERGKVRSTGVNRPTDWIRQSVFLFFLSLFLFCPVFVILLLLI